MKSLSPFPYLNIYLSSPLDRRTPDGRMFCIRAEATWCAHRTIDQGLQPNATGGTPAIHR